MTSTQKVTSVQKRKCKGKERPNKDTKKEIQEKMRRSVKKCQDDELEKTIMVRQCIL